jgi:1,2-diacylglycerol 3-alpha-glucosyltransferase
MKRYAVAMVAACPFPANYGTPGAIREMSATLAAQGHQIHIVTYPFGEDLPVGNANIWRVRIWGPSQKIFVGPSFGKLLLDLFLIIELCRVVRREHIDIIHAHNYEGALIGFIAKVLVRRPLVYNAVNLMSDELPSYDFLKPAFLAVWLAHFLDWLVTKIPDYVIAITEDLRKSIIARGIDEQRVVFIPCGVNLQMFASGNGELLRARHQVGGRPVVMYTGVASRFQRLDYLLRAFALVLLDEPQALLIIVSPLRDDPDFASSRKIADSLGILSNITWIGGHSLSELPDYLAMASVAVLPRPSVPGHPIKLLNYMAAGKAIACFTGGAKGVRHMRDAYVVPDHDYRALGRAIVALLHDRELAAKLGAAARETVAREFDWRRLCRSVETVYQEVAATGPEPPSEIVARPVAETRLAREAAQTFGEPTANATQPDLFHSGRDGQPLVGGADLPLEEGYRPRSVGG